MENDPHAWLDVFDHFPPKPREERERPPVKSLTDGLYEVTEACAPPPKGPEKLY